jgi:hypothetical protein
LQYIEALVTRLPAWSGTRASSKHPIVMLTALGCAHVDVVQRCVLDLKEDDIVPDQVAREEGTSI